MSDTLAEPESKPASPSIEAGDRAAAAGEWVQALATWERLLDTPDRKAASQRIRWFLDETTKHASARRFDPELRFDRRRLLLAGLVCAVAGTACVFLGQGQSGTARNLLAAFAWVLYLATATLVVAYAFASGPPSQHDRPGPTGSELHRAREIASSLSSCAGRPVRQP